MVEHGVPVAFTLFLWWSSTLAILWLDGLPRATFRWTFAGASVLGVVGLWGLAALRSDTSPAAAYCAFSCAMAVWAWQEVAFLLGYVTGPRRSPCPPDARGWRRAGHAFAAIAHHELALVALAAASFALTAGGANHVGLWTFGALWVLRLSAKLNLFLGVRNPSEEFLPDHLRYLGSYFRRRAMNPLFPLALLAATIATVLVWQRALAPDGSAFEATAFTLLGTLFALGCVEHVFLMLPLPTSGLWRWGLRSRDPLPQEPGHRAV
jgi:putative photosynthetic complex assembly protein 2